MIRDQRDPLELGELLNELHAIRTDVAKRNRVGPPPATATADLLPNYEIPDFDDSSDEPMCGLPCRPDELERRVKVRRSGFQGGATNEIAYVQTAGLCDCGHNAGLNYQVLVDAKGGIYCSPVCASEAEGEESSHARP